VTIIGRGDLSPPRRHRPGGRRGGRRWLRAFVVLLLLAALGAGGWFGWRHFRNNDTATVGTGPTPCVTPTGGTSQHAVSTAPAKPVRVLNGTLRPGLAASVAKALHRSGPRVRVARIGNAVSFMRGRSKVSYPPALAAEARSVAAAVYPPAQLVESAATTVVELNLGSAFRRMASTVEYTAELARLSLGASPRASVSPSSSSCPAP
jgi:hypothetical protein